MTRTALVLASAVLLASPLPASAQNAMSFFITSKGSGNGANLGGLKGADAHCQALAKAAGSTKTWQAYLSTSGSGSNAVNAKDRIGKGPWFNAKGAMLAANLADLHSRKGDAEVFLDEKGNKINGQWTGSPSPNQHDILTGTKQDGTKSTDTCDNWTSDASSVTAAVGHSDGLGPMMATTGTYTSWNASHTAQDCSNTAPRGGAGKIYCFAAD